MTDGHPALVLRRPCRPRGERPAEDETDRQLLERFVARQEEAAFAALVARHGSGVLALCRRVLRHEQDAEDAFQATFLVLARKAGVVRWQCSVKRWLLAVAYRLSLRARSSATRRRLRERPIEPAAPQADEDGSGWDGLPEKHHPQTAPLAEVERRELRRVVASELAGLPEKYRAPVVLCYLEGKTNEEAAGQLGWPTGSMSGRLARARALLQQRLARRGLALLIVLAGLAGTALCVRLGRPERLTSPVAQAMAPFRPTSAGGQGIEGELLRLADEGGPGPDRARLARMARQTAQVADTLDRHAPEQRQQEWRTFSAEMRASAVHLAAALDSGEDRAAARSARRLTASCQRCHESFRD
jgi:RNA polymerase sigma-70 factor (ECF subfamily)